jgi:hypothetical protein
MDVVLTELGGRRRTVTFSGSTAPNQGAEITDQRVTKRTLYPGSRRASTQDLGLDPQPLSLEGRLSDRLLGAAGDASALVGTLRSIMRAGEAVEIAWGSEVCRRGTFKTFTAKPMGQGVFEYSMEIEPDEDALDDRPERVDAASQGDLATTASAGIVRVNSAIAAVQPPG